MAVLYWKPCYNEERYNEVGLYRSRSVGQCGCRVGTSRRSHMQGLMVVGFIVNEILRVGFKNDKVTRARNIGQGH